MMAKRSVLVLALTFLSAFTLLRSASADPLNGDEDFAELARRGWAETVNNAGNFVTNVGNQGNNYAWSMIWWNGKLYVGSNADAGCGTDSGNPALVGTCATETQFLGQTVPPIPGANQRPEIWRYTPTAGDPRNGTWERVFVSPLTPLLPQFPILSPQVSRDFGYRTMILCDAGGTERLYVANFGWGGRILFTADGTTWQQASTNGLPSFTPSSGAGNLGFRAMACKDGGLWISPAGISTDTDASSDVRVFFNPNPANTSSTWRAISPTGVCDPANTYSIFDMAVFNGAVYAGAGGAPTGAQVCKTAGCLGGNPNTCTATWTKVVPGGTGRGLAGDGDPADGGVIRMNSTLDGLYLGLGRSAGDLVPAELIRINSDDTWDLIMGKPRLLSDMQALSPNTFNCNHDPDGTGTHNDVNMCFPLSHQGPGFGGGYSAATPSQSFCNGKDTYVWSFAEYDSNGDTSPELYVGTLDRGSSSGGGGGGVGGVGTACTSNSSNPSGFDLWRSDDGVTFSAVSLDGMGNSSASGIRNMAGVAGVGLFVGTANANTNVGILDPPLTPNPVTGGLQVWLGTCAPNGPLVADAAAVTQARQTTPSYKNQVSFDATNSRYVAFDDENCSSPSSCSPGNGQVSVTLDGSRSANRFCGHNPNLYEWYMGSLSGSCATLSQAVNPTTFLANTATVSNLTLCTANPTLTPACLQHPSPSIGTDYTDYPFTLKVTADDQANPSCDEVVLRASANQRPKATITTPSVPPARSGGTDSIRIDLPDFDGNGTESLNIAGTCTDPENSLAAANSCVWSAPLPLVPLPGTGLTNITCTGSPCNATSATATVSPSRGLDILLTATDDHGNKHVSTLTVQVRNPRYDVCMAPPTPITTAAPATVGIPHQVTIKVRNAGDVQETFNVTLQDPGGTVTPVTSQPVTLGVCTNLSSGGGGGGGGSSSDCASTSNNTCPFTNVIFNWTPTTASLHTITATAAIVPNETNTTNNVATLQVQVDPTPLLAAAALPSSRSVEVGAVASFFGTILNAGPGTTAHGCRIAPITVLPGPPVFTYQTTDASNVPTGTPNTPVDILSGTGQTFVFTFQPSVAFPQTQVQLSYDCDNTNPAPIAPGVNTVALLAANDPVPDIVALAATNPNDLILRIPTPLPNAAAFGVATVNVGAGGSITASADTGGVSLTGVTVTICETTGQPGGACIATPSASVTTQIDANETNTFSIFVSANASANVAFLPATNRIQVHFTGGGGGGGTSVAVCTKNNASCPP